MLALREWSAYELPRQLGRRLELLAYRRKRLVRRAQTAGAARPGHRQARAGRDGPPRQDGVRDHRPRPPGAGRMARQRAGPAPASDRVHAPARYADQGSKQDLLAAVRSIRRWVLAQAPAGLWHIRGYLDPEPIPTGCTLLPFSPCSMSTCSNR